MKIELRKGRSRLWSIALFAIGTTSVLAQSGRSVMAQQLNCDRPQTEVEVRACIRLRYEAADKRLNDVYKQLIAKLSKEDKALLLEAQLGWIKQRDYTCEFEVYRNRGGSGFQGFLNECLERSTKQRTAELEKFSAVILAQSTPTIESLPNGDYFYGQAGRANQVGTEYIFLRKASNTVTGFGYTRNTGNRYCFRGTVKSSTITNGTYISFEEGEHEQPTFSQFPSLDLSSFYRLNGSDSQVNTKQRLTQCIELFEENNKLQNLTKPRS